ncbi:hypothetical protein [Catellatospora sp. NPDC049133]|jgi:hypothetical protein|uniref:hypothetical protein n=1 Tax=Catellatospora sp. NPDC049133 TaxID=3155499 RepID=UPI0033C6E153
MLWTLRMTAAVNAAWVALTAATFLPTTPIDFEELVTLTAPLGVIFLAIAVGGTMARHGMPDSTRARDLWRWMFAGLTRPARVAAVALLAAEAGVALYAQASVILGDELGDQVDPVIAYTRGVLGLTAHLLTIAVLVIAAGRRAAAASPAAA